MWCFVKKHIFILTRIYDMMIVKKVFCEKTQEDLLGYETGFLLTRIYDMMIVKKVFCEKTYEDLLGYETGFILTWIYDRLFVKKVFCEKTQEELWYFLCKDTQISCINRFYSYSDLSVFVRTHEDFF